jgi:hypothetical protein
MVAVTLAVAVVGALALGACGESPTTTLSDDPDVVELIDHRNDWAERGLDSYRLTVETQCFCPVELNQPRTITVEHGEVTAEDPVPAVDLPDRIMTVDDLFNVAQEALHDADQAEIDYDPEYEFPARIAVDQVSEAIDDEVTYVVTGFEVVDA